MIPKQYKYGNTSQYILNFACIFPTTGFNKATSLYLDRHIAKSNKACKARLLVGV